MDTVRSNIAWECVDVAYRPRTLWRVIAKRRLTVSDRWMRVVSYFGSYKKANAEAARLKSLDNCKSVKVQQYNLIDEA